MKGAEGGGVPWKIEAKERGNILFLCHRKHGWCDMEAWACHGLSVWSSKGSNSKILMQGEQFSCMSDAVREKRVLFMKLCVSDVFRGVLA